MAQTACFCAPAVPVSLSAVPTFSNVLSRKMAEPAPSGHVSPTGVSEMCS